LVSVYATDAAFECPGDLFDDSVGILDEKFGVEFVENGVSLLDLVTLRKVSEGQHPNPEV
jgi:hypothetical protein